MEKKKNTGQPTEIPLPGKLPVTEPAFDPEDPVLPIEDPDMIPDEDPFITPPDEMPAPAEGP